MAVQPTTQVLETVDISKTKKEELVKKIGRSLGSPISGKQVGERFNVTLTGKIEIRQYGKDKGAYYTTKEGFSIRVNASFDPTIHKADAVFEAVCLEIKENKEQGILRDTKYCAFA